MYILEYLNIVTINYDFIFQKKTKEFSEDWKNDIQKERGFCYKTPPEVEKRSWI